YCDCPERVPEAHSKTQSCSEEELGERRYGSKSLYCYCVPRVTSFFGKAGKGIIFSRFSVAAGCALSTLHRESIPIYCNHPLDEVRICAILIAPRPPAACFWVYKLTVRPRVDSMTIPSPMVRLVHVNHESSLSCN